MTWNDMARKLTSRKFWVAVAAFVSGLILARGGAESTAATVSGVILQGAAVIGYLLAEGLTDYGAAKGDAIPQVPEQITGQMKDTYSEE